jgi:hypothetical protein
MKILISEVENLSSPFARIFPIQSKKQLYSYIFFTLVGFIFFQVLLMIFGTPFVSPLVLIFSFIGSSVVLRMTLPGKFFVEVDASEKSTPIINEVLARLEKYGYKATHINTSTVDLEANLPSFLKWDQNRISIFRSSTKITLTGPIFMMRIIRENLEMKPPLSGDR